MSQTNIARSYRIFVEKNGKRNLHVICILCSEQYLSFFSKKKEKRVFIVSRYRT